MRIIGGKYKGTALASLGAGDAAAHLRPTSDRTRESLFNLLAHGDYPALADARVLDLFAGTGALGFEALSRGAGHVLFVDDGAKSRAIIRQNIDTLRAIGPTRLFRRDATRLGENNDAPYDFIFADPPYGKGMGERALTSAIEGGWVAPGAVVILEETAAANIGLIAGLNLVDERRYGDTIVRILRAK